MKLFKWLALLMVIILVVAFMFNYPKLNIISGYDSKNMASSVFIGHRKFASVTENDNNVPM